MITVAPLWHKDIPDDARAVNTTSKGVKELSPFYLGPVIVEPQMYEYHISRNMENAWQYSKVYSEQFSDCNRHWYLGWLDWAKKGWSKTRANRYPMGKGAVPEFSMWQGSKLDYIESRKKIYGPLYIGAVIKTATFVELLKAHRQGENIWLLDYDAYITDDDFETILNNRDKKMGHAFWLKKALEMYSG